MTLIAEGARGNTLIQLETALHLPLNKDDLRNAYKNLTGSLAVSKHL